MKKLAFLFLMFLVVFQLNAQNDSIILANKAILIGEIKSMDKGVLVFKTNYSDSDFKITWKEIKELYSNSIFIVALSNGERLSATVQTDSENKNKVLIDAGGYALETTLKKIIFLDPTGKNFFSRLKASFDIGLTIAKSNNLRQLNANANIGYRSQKWNLNGSFDFVFSQQDETEDIERTEGNLNFQRILPKEWFVQASTDFLSNSEQLLKLRTTARIGPGYYFKHTNLVAFGTLTGLAFNHESYSDVFEENKSSMEYFIGLSYEKYNIGDLSILTTLIASPSFTEKGRFRTDFRLDLKYDLPLDFYIKMGVTHNFDNQPVEGAAKDDYVFKTSFGWELD